MIKRIIFIIFTIVLSGCSWNEGYNDTTSNEQKAPKIASLDNQKKCSEASEDFFNEKYKINEQTPSVFHDYTNHYNTSDGSCYILVDIDSNINGIRSYRSILFDVFENQIIEGCGLDDYLCKERINKYMIE